MTDDHPTVDDLVRLFGEEHREVITRSIQFLDQNEPRWGLNEPVDRVTFLSETLLRTAPTPAQPDPRRLAFARKARRLRLLLELAGFAALAFLILIALAPD